MLNCKKLRNKYRWRRKRKLTCRTTIYWRGSKGRLIRPSFQISTFIWKSMNQKRPLMQQSLTRSMVVTPKKKASASALRCMNTVLQTSNWSFSSTICLSWSGSHYRVKRTEPSLRIKCSRRSAITRSTPTTDSPIYRTGLPTQSSDMWRRTRTRKSPLWLFRWKFLPWSKIPLVSCWAW